MGHSLHVLAPATAENDPARHVTHVDLSIAAVALELVPAAHQKGDDNPVVLQYPPISHCAQTDAFVLFVYVPISHPRQLVLPVVFEYVPARHVGHAAGESVGGVT